MYKQTIYRIVENSNLGDFQNEVANWINIHHYQLVGGVSVVLSPRTGLFVFYQAFTKVEEV